MDDNLIEPVNFNTEEAKIAKEVALQFVTKRSGAGRPIKKLRKETEVMFQAIEDIPSKQTDYLQNLVAGLGITKQNGLGTCLRVSDMIFKDQMCWGRVVTFFMFVGFTIDHAKLNGDKLSDEEVSYWLAVCIARKSQWIRENGEGWQGFIRTLGGPRETFFNGLFNVTLGLGSIAAALYIQGR